MDTLRLRLREYLNERGLSAYALIQASGLAPNTVYAIARDSSGNARLDTLAGILTGLRRLTGAHVALSDILVDESMPTEGAPQATDASRVHAIREEPESAPGDSEWLQAFIVAAEGQSGRLNALHPGRVVLVQLNGQQLTPGVTLTPVETARKSQAYGIVPLGPPLAHPLGGMTPTFTKREGGLPANSTALCIKVQTVEPERVVGFVGKLEARQVKRIRDCLKELLIFDRASDGRNVRQ